MGNSILLYLFLVLQLNLFGLNYFTKTMAVGAALGSLMIALLWEVNFKSYFKKPILYFFLFCGINMIWCFVSQGQSPVAYIMGEEFTNMLELLVLFAIPVFGVKSNDIEKVLMAVGLTCIVIYLAQYLLHIPLVVSEEDIETQDMDMRARINGQCLFVLLYFKSFSMLLKKFSILHVAVLLTSLLCIFVLGFRSQVSLIALISIALYFKYNKFQFKTFLYSIILSVVLYGVYQSDIVQYKINQMTERNERDNFNDNYYIRYRSLNYYVYEFPENVVDRIIGKGLPGYKSSYAKKINNLKSRGLVYTDWGLVGLIFILGIPAVLCIVWYAVKAFLTPVKKEYSYLCYWFLFMLLASILTREIYRMGAFAVQGVVLYMIAKNRLNKKTVELRNLLSR